MTTDWLHDPCARTLASPLAVLLCSLVLALTRRRFPPAEPRWRLWRALFIIAVAATVPAVGLGGGSWALVAGTIVGASRVLLELALYLISWGVFVGWLVPCVLEGRSLAQIGWVRHRAALYLACGAMPGFVIACVLPVARNLPEIPDVFPTATGFGLIALLPLGAVLVCIALGLMAGWTEENLFRGHLMPSLVECGVSARGALIGQALIFAIYHFPGDLATALAMRHVPYGVAGSLISGFLGRAAWGLLYGHLRRRTGSILPGFALHAAFDAARIMLMVGPTVVAMGILSKG